jgi:hypothetical protein
MIQRKIEKTDLQYLDPSERAELVNAFLFSALGISDPKEVVEHPLYWDLICWCSGMVAYFAMGTEDADLMALAKILNKQIFSLHYSLPDGEPELGPNREEHKQIWIERIEGIGKHTDILKEK